MRGTSYTSSEINEDGNGNLLVNLNCFDDGGGFIDKGLIYTTGKPNTAPITPGEILIAITEVTREAKIIGYPLFVPQSVNTNSIFHSMDTAHLKFKNTLDFDKNFLYYFLRSELYHKKILAITGGTTVLHLNLGFTEKIQIPLLSRDEQEEIASILASADTRIQVEKQNYEKLRKLRAGLVKDLLTPTVRVQL